MTLFQKNIVVKKDKMMFNNIEKPIYADSEYRDLKNCPHYKKDKTCDRLLRKVKCKKDLHHCEDDDIQIVKDN
jgi:hypothetical protein